MKKRIWQQIYGSYRYNNLQFENIYLKCKEETKENGTK